MKPKKVWAFILIVLGGTILFGTTGGTKAGAATRFVSADSGTNVGNCLLLSCKTVTYAVSQAVNGDIIDVSWGTYDAALGESVPITITKNVMLKGAGSSNTSIVSVRVENAAVDIRGFKVQGGIVYHFGSGTIDHNEIVDGSGDGIYSDRADTTIHTNLIRGNARYGIGNYARNNRIYNNTIVENGGGGNGGGIGALTSDPIIKNNIIVSNTGYGIESNTSSSPPNDYNDVWNNSLGNYSPTVIPGSHSQSADPLFGSPTNLRPQCAPSSPVINKGDNSEVGSQITDLGDIPRIVGEVVDIGAYEAVCNRYVADSGSNTGYCLSVSAPCKTIGYAASQAFPGRYRVGGGRGCTTRPWAKPSPSSSIRRSF